MPRQNLQFALYSCMGSVKVVLRKDPMLTYLYQITACSYMFVFPLNSRLYEGGGSRGGPTIASRVGLNPRPSYGHDVKGGTRNLVKGDNKML